MMRTRILVHAGWGPKQGFQHCFADGLNLCLESFVVQATKLFLLQDIYNITINVSFFQRKCFNTD